MVLVLLGLVIFSVLMGRNLSSYVKENLVVSVMLEQDMTNSEVVQMCKQLKAKPYVKSINYISKAKQKQEYGCRSVGIANRHSRIESG